MAIDFNVKPINTSGYTYLNNGDIIRNEDLEAKVASGEFIEANIDPNKGNFGRGIQQGLAQEKATLGGGLRALLGDATGNKELQNRGLNYYKNQMAVSDAYSKDTDKVEGVDGVGSALDFASNALGQQVPGLATSILGGGISGVVGKQVAKVAVKKTLNNLVEKEVAKSSLISSTGLQAGLFGYGAADTAGSIYPEALENKASNPVGSALAGGLVGGALNLVGDSALLGNVLSPAIKSSNLGARLLGNIGYTAAVNSATGVAGEVNNRYFQNEDLGSAESISGYLNAGVAGAIGGAPFGAPSALTGKPRNAENTITNTDIVNNINNEPQSTVLDNNTVQNEQSRVNNEVSKTVLNENNTALSKEAETLNTQLKQEISDDKLFTNEASYTPEQLAQNISEDSNLSIKTPLDSIDMSINQEQNNKPYRNAPLSDLGFTSTKPEVLGNSIDSLLTSDLSSLEQADITELKKQVRSNLMDTIEGNQISKLKEINDINNSLQNKFNSDKLNAKNIVNPEVVKENIDTPIKDKISITKELQETNNGITDTDFIRRVNTNKNINLAYQRNPGLIEDTYRNNKTEINSVAKQINDTNLTSVNNYADYKNISNRENFIKQIDTAIAKRLSNSSVKHNIISRAEIPFAKKDILGYYNPETNQISIISDNVLNSGMKADDVSTALLNHELLHAGIYKLIKESDRPQYERELTLLNRNKTLSDLTTQLQKDFGYDQFTAIEEGLARMAETGEFRNLKGIDKFIDYMKKLLSKMLDTKQPISDEEVHQYIGRAVEFALNDREVQSISRTSSIESVNYMTDTGNMPADIMFSEIPKEQKEVFIKQTEAQRKSLEEFVKDFGKDLQGQFILDKNSTQGKTLMERVAQKMDNIIQGWAQRKNPEIMEYNRKQIGPMTRALSSIRELASMNESTEALHKTFQMEDTQFSHLNKQTIERVKKINELKKRLKSDKDDIALSQIITEFGLQQNEGNGRRPSEQEVIDKINTYTDKNGYKVNNKQVVFDLYKLRRENFDLLINKRAFSEAINIVNQLERAIEIDPNANKSLILKLREDIFNVINNEDYDTFFKTLNEIPNTENPFNLTNEKAFQNSNELKDSIRTLIEEKDISINEFGYVPKDHTGKYTVNMQLKYLDEAGEEKYFTFGVPAFENAIKRNTYKLELDKMAIKMQELGMIQDANLLTFKIEDRSQNTYGNTNPLEFINKFERNGEKLTPEQKRSILSTSKAFSLLERKFKGGIGYDLNLDKVAFRQIDKINNDISRNVFYNKEIDIMSELKGPDNVVARDIAIEMQNAKRESATQTGDEITSRLRGFGSLWYLGGNLSSVLMQNVQFMQASPAWFSQYGGNSSLFFTTKNLYKAFNYLRTGTTGDAVLDKVIRDFDSNLIGANQNAMLFNLKQGEQFESSGNIDKIKNLAFWGFGKAETANRIGNLINSYEIFNNPDKYKGRKSVGDNFIDFATENIIRVNGDYSGGNTPKVLRGPVAQTLFMFQAYKIFMFEMVKNMDNKARAQFFMSLAMTGGMLGMPFAEDGLDLLDYLYKLFNVPKSSRKDLDDFLKDMGEQLGWDKFETYAKYGVIPSAGVRAGVGGVIPGFAGILDIASGEGTQQSVTQVFGPTSAVFVNTLNGLGSAGSAVANGLGGEFGLVRSDVTSAIKQFAPSSVKNVIKGGQQFFSGDNGEVDYSVNAKGTGKNMNTDWFDNTMQVMGFQTVSQLNSQQDQRIIRDVVALKKSIKDYYRDTYLQASLTGDTELQAQVIRGAREFSRMAKESGSGYAFNVDAEGWRKQAKANTLQMNDRTIEGVDKELRPALNAYRDTPI